MIAFTWQYWSQGPTDERYQNKTDLKQWTYFPCYLHNNEHNMAKYYDIVLFDTVEAIMYCSPDDQMVKLSVSQLQAVPNSTAGGLYTGVRSGGLGGCSPPPHLFRQVGIVPRKPGKQKFILLEILWISIHFKDKLAQKWAWFEGVGPKSFSALCAKYILKSPYSKTSSYATVVWCTVTGRWYYILLISYNIITM